MLAIAIFDEIYVLNGTALNTRSMLIQVYNTTFVDADFAHGTALAFMLTVVTALFAIAVRARLPAGDDVTGRVAARASAIAAILVWSLGAGR